MMSGIIYVFIGFILGIFWEEYKSRRNQRNIFRMALLNIKEEMEHNIVHLEKTSSVPINESILPFTISEIFETSAWNMALSTGAFRLYKNLDLLTKRSRSYLNLENITNLSKICTEYFYSTASAMSNFKTNFKGLGEFIFKLKQGELENLKKLIMLLQKEIS